MTVVLALLSMLALGAPPQEAIDAHKHGMELSKSNPAQAIELLEKAVKIDPEFSEAWMDLGQTHLTIGSMDEAIHAFQEAVRIRSDFQIARYNLAYALRKTNQHAKAAEQYRLYLQRDPDDADAWYGLAESLRQANDAVAAAEAYEHYAKVEKRPQQQRWVKKAEEQAKQLRATGPSGVTPPKGPGRDKETTAIASQQTMPMVNGQPPKTAKTPVTASGSKHVSFSSKPKKEEPAAAQAEEKKPPVNAEQPVAAKSSEPKAAVVAKRPASFDDGIASLKSGDYEGALPRLEAAAKDAPEDAMVLAALGSAHLGLREGKQAELAYRRALATAKPEAVPGIWLGIGEAMRLMGDSTQALEAFDRVAKDEVASASIKAAAEERAASLR